MWKNDKEGFLLHQEAKQEKGSGLAGVQRWSGGGGRGRERKSLEKEKESLLT
jgi:hypothetical protein